MKIGETLKELRLVQGWTQDQLADMAGTTAANISRIETGKHGVGTDLLNSFAYVFGYKVYQIIAMAEGYNLSDAPERFSPEEITIITSYRLMNKEQKKLLENLITVLAKSQK